MQLKYYVNLYERRKPTKFELSNQESLTRISIKGAGRGFADKQLGTLLLTVTLPIKLN